MRLREVVALALLLRLLRAVARWDEVALAYAAYGQAWQDAFFAGRWREALASFVGLHPPLYAFLQGLVDRVWGAPAGWLLLSALLSTSAVWMVGRLAGAGAALVLALDPLQLAYAAEVNNYPLATACVAACLLARRRAAEGRGAGALALSGIAAGWSHLLAGLAAGLCALTLLPRRPRAALGVLGAMALGCAPVVAVALRLAGRGSTFGQGGWDPSTTASRLWEVAGPWLAVPLLGLLAARRRPAEALVALGTSAALLAWMLAGVAAAHQLPYETLLGPPLAVLAGSLPWSAGAWLAVVLAVPHLADQVRALRSIGAGTHRPRAMDRALAASGPGDALWLLAPALRPDDDKRATSDVLWRLPPWTPMAAWRGPGGEVTFEYADYGWGQPRTFRGRVVHTSTDLWLPQFDQALRWHLGAGGTVWLVLYDHGPARDYPGKVRRALRPWRHACREVGIDAGLGTDLLCRVEGPLPPEARP